MNAPDLDERLGLDLKAAATKCSLSVKTLTRAIKFGKLIAAKFGRAVRVSPVELTRWFESHLVRLPSDVRQKPVNKKNKGTGADTNGQQRTGKPAKSARRKTCAPLRLSANSKCNPAL